MSSPPTGGYNCGGGGEKDEEEEEEEEKLAVVELGNGLAATARRKAAHSSTVLSGIHAGPGSVGRSSGRSGSCFLRPV